MQPESVELVVVVASGLVAGLLSTAAGLGGGLVFVAGLSLAVPAKVAIVAAAPVLLVGSAVRSWVLRAHVDREATFASLAGVVPGAAIGGLVLTAIPARAVSLSLAIFLWVILVAEFCGFTARLARSPGRVGFAAIGCTAGFVAATVGGSGPLVAPALLARRPSPTVFVATMAAIGTGLEISRAVAYATAGAFITSVAVYSIVGVIGVLLGNVVGHRVLRRIRPAICRTLLRGIIGAAALNLTYRLLQ